MKQVFGLVRYIALLGVLASALLSAGLYVAIVVASLLTLGVFVADPFSEHALHDMLGRAIEQTDMLLVATTLLIVAIGLYSLFIGRMGNLPPSLEITSFSSLKEKLIALVVAVLAVHFYSVVTSGAPGPEILAKGGAIGAVIAALAFYTLAVHLGHGGKGDDE